MINHKYNISEEEIFSVSESLPAELVQLTEEVILNSTYRITNNGMKVPGVSGQILQSRPVTVRSSHDQANSETAASTTLNKVVLSAPSQHAVASEKDKKKHK